MALRSDLEQDDLFMIADEIELTIPENANVKDLRNLIEHSDVFKNDTEFVLGFIDTVVDERVEQLERDKQMHELEKKKAELKKIKAECQKAKTEREREKAERANQLRELELEKTELDKVIRGIKILTHPVSVNTERECETKFNPEKIESAQLGKVNTELQITEILSKTMSSADFCVNDKRDSLIDFNMDSEFHKDCCETGLQKRLFPEQVDNTCYSNEGRFEEFNEGSSVIEMGKVLNTRADMVDLCLTEDRMSGGCEMPTDTVSVLSGYIGTDWEVIEDNLYLVAVSVCGKLRSDESCLDSADDFSFRELGSDCCERDKLLVREGQDVKPNATRKRTESRRNLDTNKEIADDLLASPTNGESVNQRKQKMFFWRKLLMTTRKIPISINFLDPEISRRRSRVFERWKSRIFLNFTNLKELQ